MATTIVKQPSTTRPNALTDDLRVVLATDAHIDQAGVAPSLTIEFASAPGPTGVTVKVLNLTFTASNVTTQTTWDNAAGNVEVIAASFAAMLRLNIDFHEAGITSNGGFVFVTWRQWGPVANWVHDFSNLGAQVNFSAVAGVKAIFNPARLFFSLRNSAGVKIGPDYPAQIPVHFPIQYPTIEINPAEMIRAQFTPGIPNPNASGPHTLAHADTFSIQCGIVKTVAGVNTFSDLVATPPFRVVLCRFDDDKTEGFLPYVTQQASKKALFLTTRPKSLPVPANMPAYLYAYPETGLLYPVGEFEVRYTITTQSGTVTTAAALVADEVNAIPFSPALEPIKTALGGQKALKIKAQVFGKINATVWLSYSEQYESDVEPCNKAAIYFRESTGGLGFVFVERLEGESITVEREIIDRGRALDFNPAEWPNAGRLHELQKSAARRLRFVARRMPPAVNAYAIEYARASEHYLWHEGKFRRVLIDRGTVEVWTEGRPVAIAADFLISEPVAI